MCRRNMILWMAIQHKLSDALYRASKPVDDTHSRQPFLIHKLFILSICNTKKWGHIDHDDHSSVVVSLSRTLSRRTWNYRQKRYPNRGTNTWSPRNVRLVNCLSPLNSSSRYVGTLSKVSCRGCAISCPLQGSRSPVESVETNYNEFRRICK